MTSYAVGYGHPPLHSRFAPGKSGSPKGRPKGQLNLETALKNELNRLITIREGDRSRRLKKGTAWIVKTVNGALNNDAKANATLVALLRAVVLGQPSQAPAETPLTSDDQGLLANYLERHGNSNDDAPDNAAGPLQRKPHDSTSN
ncbi:MAG TPA: DUF5681 domain-containing protein [Rhizomicrobium sp.]|nr:DUF5681 domain-containing protein [Rhizomicrobium sp.]